MEFTKKRVTVKIELDNNSTYTSKVWEIFLNNLFVCFMEKDGILNEFNAFQSPDNDFICGGLTLTEAMESLERGLNNKSIKLVERPQI